MEVVKNMSHSIFRTALTEPTAGDPHKARETGGIGARTPPFTGLLQLDDVWRGRAERPATAGTAPAPPWCRTDQRVYAADRFTGAGLDFDGDPTLTRVRPTPPAGAGAATTASDTASATATTSRPAATAAER